MIDLYSRNEAIPSGPNSRPIPEALRPPNGASGFNVNAFTETVPVTSPHAHGPELALVVSAYYFGLMAQERQSRAAPAEYDLDAVRSEWIGRTVASSRGRYPVEHDPIRRYCHMVGDTNPLYLDPDEARAGPYGRVIVPLPLVPYFAGNGPWPRHSVMRERRAASPSFTYGVPTPGDRGLNMNTTWTYLQPVGVGDQLRAQVVINDVFTKPVRLDPAAIWIVTLTSIRNQVDEIVMETRNTVLVHRSRAELSGADGR